jgi:hypothetical protein
MLESERVGEFTVCQSSATTLRISVDIDLPALAFEFAQSGDLSPTDAKRPRTELRVVAEQRIAALHDRLPDALRSWFTNLLLWDSYARDLTDNAFLAWLDREEYRLPQLLGVQAVQARLKVLRWDRRTSKHREQLGRIIARWSDGRPRGVPHAKILYYEVKRAQEMLTPLCTALKVASNRASIWKAIGQHEPNVAAEWHRLGLDRAWFHVAQKDTRRRKELTPYGMASRSSRPSEA